MSHYIVVGYGDKVFIFPNLNDRQAVALKKHYDFFLKNMYFRLIEI